MHMRLRNLILFLLAAGVASAAVIDGTWTSEIKGGGKKGAAAARTINVTLNLRSDGNRITGTVVTAGRKRSRTAQIQEGKLDGTHFSFVAVQTTKKGEQRIEWRGTVAGDSIEGTRGREGRRRGQPFTAKRS